MISIVPYGDSALLVNFKQRISKRILVQVTAYAEKARTMEGVRYVIPAFCSLTVVYDRSRITYEELCSLLLEPISTTGTEIKTPPGRKVEVPVCYDAPYALDMEEVERQTGKSAEAIIRAHLGREFHVYMLGFMPGFTYLGDMPRGFSCQRRAEPRTRVPAGSVGLAGLQTALYSFDTPGGWQIIGRTPVRLFDAEADPPNFLRPGDRVRFKRIRSDEFGVMS